MDCLCISLFGKFCVTAPVQTTIVLDPTKVQELFFYLLLHADRPHTREKLAELLWQDSSAAQSRKYLRQTLWQLQSILDQFPCCQNLLTADSDWIQINPAVPYWLDTQMFDHAYGQATGVDGAALETGTAQALMNAVMLYQGDLLENWYQDWCLFERERLQNELITMLHKLMVYCECTQQYEAGVIYGMQMLQFDQAREQTHRRLMRLYFLAGDRTRALRQFERCKLVLRQELGVEPAQKTLELVQQIRQGTLSTPHSPAFQLPARPISAPPAAELLAHLHQLKETLLHAQAQIDRNINLLQNQQPQNP
ncbi:MAG: hypothetical protein H6659_07395 [Ardenticatenaceae bacterium]|nr:hypothetical protein [Ardenticatenaceae bacterium]